jgi:hypothetical protein
MNDKPRNVLLTAIALSALLLAFGLGRASKKISLPVTITKEVKVHETRDIERATAGAARASETSTSDLQRDRSRITTSPGVRIVERWHEAKRVGVERAAEVQSKTVYVDREKLVTIEKDKVTISPQARWTLTAMAGKTYSWQTEVGGAVSFRVLGPATLTAWATNKGAGFGVGVTW